LFAGTGVEALARARECIPDVILLDVMIPEIDGFEVCRRLRADPQRAEVPVLLVTALDDRASRLRGIEAGADDFISKPFDRVELCARVRTITRLNRYRRLLAERANMERMAELAPDGMLIVDGDGAIVLANPAVLRLLGADQAAALLTKPITAIMPADRNDTDWTRLGAVIRDPAATVRIETVLAGSGGERLPVELHAGYFVWDNRPAVQIIVRDIGERKRAELLEEERRHIAYELHDGLAQVVTSAHQHLQSFAGHYRPRSPKAREELAIALELAQRSVKEVRRLIGGLRPTALDDFGLAAALRMQINALRADGWDITYYETLDEKRLPTTIETVVFRVVQEALVNVRKHARTTRVHLDIRLQERDIRLTVQDWGCGFDPAALPPTKSPGERMGLRSMRERVALLRGRWSIDSRAGVGTIIDVAIPLPTKGDTLT
jgi:PAS domain S-box-containing protein